MGYYPLSAALALFGNVIRDPSHVQATEDLALFRSVIKFLSDYFECKDKNSMSPHDIHFSYIMEMFQLFLKLAEDMVTRSQTQVIPPYQCFPPSDEAVAKLHNLKDVKTSPGADGTMPPTSAIYDTPNPKTWTDSQATFGRTFSTPGSSSQDMLQETTPLADNIFDNYYLADEGMMDAEILRPDDGSWFFPINDSINNDPSLWYNQNI